MGIVLNFIWGTKICLMGLNAYKACSSESGQWVVCILSSSYFLTLVLATFCAGCGFPSATKVEGLEDEYLRRLEEGIGLEENRKQK
jgi:hypothetical protein